MKTRECVYDTTKNLKCDIVTNETCTKNRDVVVIVHGGAWMVGAKESFHAMAHTICKELNVACVIPEYSLSKIDASVLFQSKVVICTLTFQLLLLLACQQTGYRRVILMVILVVLLVLIAIGIWIECSCSHDENSHPSHIVDVANCVAFACNVLCTTENTNCPLRIVLLGHSAGAHISSLLALCPTYLPQELFDCVVGAVVISGIYSYWQMQQSPVRVFLNKYIFPGMFSVCHTEESLEQLRDTDEAMWTYIRNAWPIFHATDSQRKTRFLILTSDADFSILQHSVDLERALKDAAMPVQHLHFKDTTHFSIHKHWDSKHKHIFDSVKQFIQLGFFNESTII